MDNEHSIENTKKYAIMEVMFYSRNAEFCAFELGDLF